MNDNTIYENLLKEIKETGIESKDLWKLWHGDTHMIADDHKHWKNKCPTFNYIIKHDDLKRTKKRVIRTTKSKKHHKKSNISRVGKNFV